MLSDITFMPLAFLRPFWLLGIVAVLLVSVIRYKATNNKQQGLIAPHLSEHLVNLPSASVSQRLVFPLLLIIACIALAGPSFRSINMPIYQMEKAQVLVMDLSYSMYATDLQPNRLSQQKYKAIDLIKQWREGEKGLISYAGEAFTISPLTADGNAIINHIPNLSPEIMPVTGSRADLALERAISLLKNAGYNQGHIVFFTDGIAAEQAQKMQKMLKDSPWVVSVLGLATPQGAAIKMPDGSLLKNQQDEIVVPKLHSQPLRELARVSDGLYLRATTSNKDIEQLGSYFQVTDSYKDDSSQSSQSQFNKDDGYWLSFVLLPLMLALFRKGGFYLFLVVLTWPLSSADVNASMWQNDQQNALQAYQQQDYETAAQLYDEPMAKGSALYKSQRYEDALAQFTQASQAQPDNADAFYNQGNSYAQLQKFAQAIEAYEQALSINPDFKAALENKQLIEQLQKQQQQQSNEQQQSEQQNSEQQQSEQQSSEQQNSEQQNSEQQNSEQQNSEQQQSEQQNSEQQNSEQQNSEQQNSEQQNSEQQNSEQQSSEQQNSEQQQSEQQSSEQQQSEQQQSEQQQSEQQQSEQQQSEQQNSEQQQSEQQQSEQQQSEQQNSEQQNSEQQNSEQQQSEQQQSASQSAEVEESPQNNQELQQLPNWLKNMPDDPSLLLRNKMRLEYQKRAQSQPVKQQQNNGEIW